MLATWGWSEPEFSPEGYRPFIDQAARHAGYNLLTTTLRIPQKELTDDDVHAHIQRGAAYARKRGLALVVDLDVRLGGGGLSAYLSRRTARNAAAARCRSGRGRGSDHRGRRGHAERPLHLCATPYVPLAGRLAIAC